MVKVANIYGGGARTNKNGLQFEQTTSLATAIDNNPDFELKGNNVYKNSILVGYLLGKHDLYNNLLIPKGVDYKKIISKKLLPDDAILVGNILYVIEKKFQSCAGSVDEKLQTCDFKKKQYIKLLEPCNIKVEYYYVFNDWFKKPEYYDVREYIIQVGCKYFFKEIPLKELGLE